MKAVAAVLLLFTTLTAAVHRDLLFDLDRAIFAPPVIAPGDGPPIGSFARGDQLLHVWALATNLRHLREDPGALFEANGFYPHPRSLFLSDHLFGESLFVWPLTAFTSNPVLLHNVALLLSFVLSGTGIALLVRMLTGSTLAGAISGIGWAFSPPRSFEIYQLQLLTTQWIPFLLMCVHVSVARRRLAPALLAAAFLSLQLLSGIYVGAYLVLCLGSFLVVQLAMVPRRNVWRVAWRLAFALGLGVAVAAPWLLQYLHVSRASGEYGGLLENVAYALSIQHYVLPSWVTASGRFPGPLVLTVGALALLGAVAPGHGLRRERWCYLVTAAWAAVLSLGPYVRYGAGPGLSAGPGFLGRGPYAVLHALVPGLDALRVPARMSLLVGFFVAVLAGLGVARLLAWIQSPGRRTGLALLLAGAILVESHPRFTHVVELLWRGELAEAILAESQPRSPEIESVPVGDDVPPVYRWLGGRGEPGAVVELPMNILRDPEYLYYSTVHWRPIVNGYGAYVPTPHRYIQTRLREFPEPSAVDVLREIGVRYVVTHDVPAVSTDGRGDLSLVQSFGTDTLYEVRPGFSAAPAPERSGLRELPQTGWRASSPSNAADAPLACDGDPRTVWSNVGDLTRRPLGRRGGGLAWLRTLDNWDEYHSAYALEGRAEFITVDLGQTVVPAAVQVLLHAHQTPIFAPFAINTSVDGSVWRRVECSWHPAVPLARYAANPADTWLELRCEFPPTRHVRLNQYPPDWRIYWELAELKVFVGVK